jgi:hypothetical protein
MVNVAMKKFVLVTRGRTGSTAIIDELGKSIYLCAMQELLHPGPFTQNVLLYYKQVAPFDVWRETNPKWKRKFFPWAFTEVKQAHRYLTYAERLVKLQGAKGFCWKALSHQFDERPYLGELLKRHEYCVIYLKRNIVDQVLSGMVANQRGVYNSLEELEDSRKFHIEIDKFKWHIEWERECVRKDIARLKSDGFNFIEVNYEDFCNDREAFYCSIFDFLGLPQELPPPSNFVKMIKDPMLVIENFDEVVKAAAEVGEVV